MSDRTGDPTRPTRFLHVGLFVATLFGVSPQPAGAHPPYEGKVAVLKAAGREIEIAKSYVAGIFFTDPAKVVVRSEGHVYAETPYFRDTSMACVSGRCLVAASDSLVSVVPERAWVIEGTSLQPRNSPFVRFFGILVHLWEHLLGHAFALLSHFSPRSACESSLTGPLPKEFLARSLPSSFALSSFVLFFFLLYVVLLLS